MSGARAVGASDRVVAVQLVVFVVIALAAGFIGSRLVFGGSPLTRAHELRATVGDARGLIPGTEVTLRGVPVGKVTDVTVGSGGVADIRMRVDAGLRIPGNSVARVEISGAMGAQTVVIDPVAGGGVLNDGDVVAMPAEAQPIGLPALLVKLDTSLREIDPESVRNLGQAFDVIGGGRSETLSTFVADVDALTRTLADRAPTLRGMLEAGLPVIDTMAAGADGIPRTVAMAANASGDLAARRQELIYLMESGPARIESVRSLVRANADPGARLLTSMVDVTPILGRRSATLQTGFSSIPAGLRTLSGSVTGNSANFILVGAQGPVCYFDVGRRSTSELGPRELESDRFCPQGLYLGQRGAASAPRPDDIGRTNWRREGQVAGPPYPADPLLVPSGHQITEYWRSILEGIAR